MGCRTAALMQCGSGVYGADHATESSVDAVKNETIPTVTARALTLPSLVLAGCGLKQEVSFHPIGYS